MSYRDSVKRSLEVCLEKSRKLLRETREGLEKEGFDDEESRLACEEQLQIWEEGLNEEERRIAEIFK